MGRPSTASLNSVNSQLSELRLEHNDSHESDEQPHDETEQSDDARSLLNQVMSWLENEKVKRSSRKHKHWHWHSQPPQPAEAPINDGSPVTHTRPRRDSDLSEADIALNKLERILASFTSSRRGHASRSVKQHSLRKHRRASTTKKLKRHQSGSTSDTDYQEGDLLVPGVNAVLDNSKALAYTGGSPDDDTTKGSKKRNKQQWVSFKKEIVRLTHTLKLRGWRRVPIENGGDIGVERLSGALTNAVYVVSPPEHMPASADAQKESEIPRDAIVLPQKLLLRIYGPQVEHLIDRQSELMILRRLARKRIGPRLLGTFSNGRFEEYLHARTLTAKDLRIPETSRQIAKRMRELHDGIALLAEEREDGPMVIANWRKWVARCEKVVMFIDDQIRRASIGSQNRWKSRGFICGTPWPIFHAAVERYLTYLTTRYYPNDEALKSHLVFAHNDTQYGNLLRLEPQASSPLLTPQNSHKQLVVIDFEYASANTPGFEFANHFTEWCYDYHDPYRPWACNIRCYPSPTEQRRFIKAYVEHKPEIFATPTVSPKSTPNINAKSPFGAATRSLESFLSDPRSSPLLGTGTLFEEEEKTRLEEVEIEVNRLLLETKAWRVANSAQWVAWGVVQAKVDGVDDGDNDEPNGEVDNQVTSPGKLRSPTSITQASVDWKAQGSASQLMLKPQTDPLDEEGKGLAEDARNDRPESRQEEDSTRQGDEGDSDGEEGFDYLAYAQERALLFWGDVINLGIVTEGEVKEWMCTGAGETGQSLWERIKRVDT